MSKEFKELIILDDFPINFRITCREYNINFKEKSLRFLESIAEIFKVF